MNTCRIMPSVHIGKGPNCSYVSLLHGLFKIYSKKPRFSFLACGIGYMVSGQYYRKIFEGFSAPSVSTFLFSLGLILAGLAILKNELRRPQF